MKAMVYHGANDIRFEEKPRPQIIDPTDAVVKIVKTTILFSVMKASVL